MFEPTPEQIVDIQQRYADGYPIRAIVVHYGIDIDNAKDYDTVFNVCHKRRRFGRLGDPERWAPTCMDGEEYAEWKRLMQVVTKVEHRVARPCDDCDRGFATGQRAENLCNGTLPEERVYAEAAR